MKRMFTLFLLLGSFAFSFAQCPEIVNTIFDPPNNSQLSTNEMINIGVDGINLPLGTIDWYLSNEADFDPYNGEGSAIGSSPITVNQNEVSTCDPCPQMVAIMMDACNGNSGQEYDNEFLVLSAGGGISAASQIQIDLDEQNNVDFTGTGVNNDINFGNNPCSFMDTPSPFLINTLQSSMDCNFANIIPIGPNDAIPAGALVLVFMSPNVDTNYDFNGLCANGQSIYILQSNCERTNGAFSNSSSSGCRNYQLYIGDCGSCSSSIAYDVANTSNFSDGQLGGFVYTLDVNGNGQIDYTSGCISNEIIHSNGVPCQAPPLESILLPVVPSIAEDFQYLIPLSLCNNSEPSYIKGIINPLFDNCIDNIFAPDYTEFMTETYSFTLECLEVEISGPSEFCEGELVTLDAGVGFSTYEWSNQEITQTITVSSSGFYSVTVADGSFNAGTDTFLLQNDTSPPIMDAPPLDITICDANELPEPVGLFWTDNCDGFGSVTPEVLPQANIIIYSWTYEDAGENSTTEQQMITIIDSPQPNISGSTTFCAGTSTVLDAGSYAFYQWNTGEITQTSQISIPGNYCVTVTNINGCTGEACTEIEIFPELAPVLTGSTTFCTGSSTSIDVEGSEFSDYSWSNGFWGQTIEISQQGEYCVTVTNINGCIGEACIEITESTSLQPVITGDLEFCEGESTVLDAGAGFATYQWTTGDNTQAIEVSTNDTYCLTVTGLSGCTGETCIEVDLSEITIGLFSQYIVCEGEDFTFPATASGFDLSYEWESPSGFIFPVLNMNLYNVIPDYAGIYTLTVTDANGCIATASTELIVGAIPPIDLGIDQTLCEGSGIQLEYPNNPSCSYEWADENGTLLSTNNTIEITDNLTEDITLFLTKTDNNTGCSAMDSTIIIVAETPEPSLSGSSTFCAGSSTVLAVESTYASYLWSNGETTSSIEVDISNIYSVTVTSVEGCTGTASIALTESSSLQPIPIGSAIFCESEGVIGTSAGFDSYTWNNGATTPTISVNQSDEYCVTVSDATGCTGELCIDAQVNPEILVESTSTDASCNTNDNGTINITVSGGTPPYAYAWQGSTQQPPFENLAAGMYTITISDMVGCSVVESVEVEENNDLTAELQAASDSYCGCKELIPIYDDIANLSIEWSANVDTFDNKIYACSNGSFNFIVTNITTGCFKNVDINVTLDDDSEDDNCVWPGDTDINGIVNNYDCLNIGLAFGDTGLERPGGDVSWRAQYPLPWMQSTPSTLVNYMYVDCDGGASIGHEDFDVVKDNWLLTHNFTGEDEPQYRELPIDNRSPFEVPFYVQSDTLEAESDAVLDIILGEDNAPLIGAYGIAFSILYDPAIIVPNTAMLTWDESWLGAIGTDLYALEKDFHEEGRIDIGVTRIDGQEIDGFGKIASLNITIEDVILFKGGEENRFADTMTFFTIDNYRIISASEEEIIANTFATPTLITDSLTAVSSVELEKNIQVFPNPTNKFLHISSSEYDLEQVEIYTITGQLLSTHTLIKTQNQVNVSSFDSGLYLLKIYTKAGIAFKKVSVQQ